MAVFIVQTTEAVVIIFPFITLFRIPGRVFFLSRFFEGWELLLIDGDTGDIDAWIQAKENQESYQDDKAHDEEH